jgi:hypothetical protein
MVDLYATEQVEDKQVLLLHLDIAIVSIPFDSMGSYIAGIQV